MHYSSKLLTKLLYLVQLFKIEMLSKIHTQILPYQCIVWGIGVLFNSEGLLYFTKKMQAITVMN
ncbi:hypothetical protein T10_11774 [Trichinella papuae]|uniref:Uncharacterized protein n=1 Tax=Trichinella papuae TaxID=268474 RepID=A0A0V1M6U4_9BILA|nr:hypothetical protein T10_11774 [Trichinella papuae]